MVLVKPSELRIGNIVSSLLAHDFGYKYIIVLGMDFENGKFKVKSAVRYKGQTAPVDEFEPIPAMITPEILKILGFIESKDDGIIKFTKDNLTLSCQESDISKTDYHPYIVHYLGLKMADCTYIHQLQNLYHAITGQEFEGAVEIADEKIKSVIVSMKTEKI